MLTKSEHTIHFILETVAPIFNKHGYAATSMSDLTSATGLTKGAIYGNFENKEQLAIAVFQFSVRRILKDLNAIKEDRPFRLGKLYKDAEDEKFVLNLFR